MLTPTAFAERNQRLDELLQEQGRDPRTVRRSTMTTVVFGRDDQELQAKRNGRSATELRERGVVAGTANDIVDQLGHLVDAGVQRIMLQWRDLDDIDRLEALAQSVLSQVQS